MRENMKFRAFWKNSKEFLNYWDWIYLTLKEISTIENFNDWIITQYTWLKDRNGVCIGDGDIIEISHLDWVDWKLVWKVEVTTKNWIIIRTKRFIYIVEANKPIVIGNIYESPHLINNL
jgi:hypothetical protein